MIHISKMPSAQYRIAGKDLFTEDQMRHYATECQQRAWVNLTDEEIEKIHTAWAKDNLFRGWNYERAIETKLREKNGG